MGFQSSQNGWCQWHCHTHGWSGFFQVIKSGISTTAKHRDFRVPGSHGRSLGPPVDWTHAKNRVSLKIAGSPKLQVDPHDPNHDSGGKPCETRLLLPRVFWVSWRAKIAWGDVCNCESPETQRKIIPWCGVNQRAYGAFEMECSGM